VRTEPQPHVTCKEDLLKFAHVVSLDTQVDRQTDTLITIHRTPIVDKVTTENTKTVTTEMGK